MIELLDSLPPVVRLLAIAVGIVLAGMLLIDIGIGPLLIAAGVVAVATGSGWTPAGAMWAGALSVVPSYVVACVLKPRGPCLWCKGEPKRGRTGEGYFRNCWLCGGSGQRRRIGSKVLRRHRRFVGLGGGD